MEITNQNGLIKTKIKRTPKLNSNTPNQRQVGQSNTKGLQYKERAKYQIVKGITDLQKKNNVSENKVKNEMKDK